MLTSMHVSCPEAAVDVHGDTIVVRSGALSGLFASDTELRIPLALVIGVQLKHSWFGRTAIRIELTPAFGQPVVEFAFDRRYHKDAATLVATIERRLAVLLERTLTDVQADSPTHVRQMLRSLRQRSVLTDAEYDALSRRISDVPATTEWLSPPI
jgi:hypothetical protein